MPEQSCMYSTAECQSFHRTHLRHRSAVCDLGASEDPDIVGDWKVPDSPVVQNRGCSALGRAAEEQLVLACRQESFLAWAPAASRCWASVLEIFPRHSWFAGVGRAAAAPKEWFVGLAWGEIGENAERKQMSLAFLEWQRVLHQWHSCHSFLCSCWNTKMRVSMQWLLPLPF